MAQAEKTRTARHVTSGRRTELVDPGPEQGYDRYDTVRLVASSLYTEHTEQLDKALAVLGHRLERLSERLTPALTPYDPAEDDLVEAAELATTESAGDIVDRLVNTTRRLRGYTDLLDNLHRRLILPGDTE